MPSRDRAIEARVSVTDADVGARRLERFGERGQRALEKLDRASRGTSKGLDSLDRNSARAQRGFRELASSVALVDGPLGAVSGRINTFGAVLGRIPVGAAAGIAAVAALAAGFRAVTQRGTEFERSQLRIEQLLRQTGAASGQTQQQINDLAIDIGRGTLASVEGVRRAAAALLTFRSVAGESFGDTLRLAQDLAAAGFGTLESNVVQLGKALEDPAQGLTALRRVGVSFTEQQREQIKALNEAGDVAEAQRLILQTLEAQVGGAGAAEAGGLSGAYDTLSENLGLFFERANEALGVTEALAAATRVAAEAAGVLAEAADTSTAAQLEGLDRRIADLRAVGEVSTGIPTADAARRADVERSLEPLLEQRRSLIELLRIEFTTQEAANRAAAEAAALRRQEAETATEAAEAEKEAARVEKERTRDRAAALRELETLEGRVATAGLEGVALLEARRNEALEAFRARREAELITEEEFQRARLAATEVFAREKAEIEAREADRSRRELERRARRARDAEDRALEREAEERAERLKKPMEDALEDTRDAFKDLFEDVLRDGEISFESLGEAFQRLFLQQVSTGLRSELGGVFGVGGAGPGSIFRGTTSGFSSGLLPGGGFGGRGTVPGEISVPIGGGGGFGGFGGFGTALTGIGFGIGAGNLAGSLTGGSGAGTAIGSTVGAGLGAAVGSIVPGVGTVLGGVIGGALGGGIGGLFGGGDARPNEATDLRIVDGRFVVGRTDRDNGASGERSRALATEFAEGVNALIETFGLTAQNGTRSLRAAANTRSRSDQESLPALIQRATSAGFLTGPGALGEILAATDARDFDQLAADLALGQLIEQFDEGGSRANELALALDEIGGQFDGLRRRADELGLSVEQATEALEAAERQQVEALLAPVQAFKDSLATSAAAGTPEERFAVARGNFDEAAALARGGNLAAIDAFPAQAQQFLGLAQSFFASGPEFQQAFRDVNAVLDAILAAPGFASGGSFTVPGSGGPDSRVVPLRLTPGEQGIIRTPGQRQAQTEALRALGQGQARSSAAIVAAVDRNTQAVQGLQEAMARQAREQRDATRTRRQAGGFAA